MAKYSSDSDTDRSSRHHRKHHARSRSTSSSSSDSSSYRKKSKHVKGKRRHRSRSRSRDKERSSKSYKLSRASSRDRDRRRYQPRRSKSYSPDRIKKKIRSVSREASTSRSSSSQSNVKSVGAEKLQPLAVKDDFPIEPRIKEAILDEINSDKFVPKQFSSSVQSRQTKSSNIVIDITADTIKLPTIVMLTDSSNNIFHTSIMCDNEVRFDKWVKKLYTLRQKAIADSAHSSVT
ncbi:serine/Arginine-related protein 53 isoform X2 [Neodiprion lecontei]|uniref:Serine/Arginine-related protein 53 isoform X2 n=1 Tax=Neodiprion lecontei TaxID=441921 RepID=A0A6J0BLV4_NEOLC|nr:serine/Arginine-related protein 53 isoform X2 [Neodiprion lecontei]